AAPGIANGCGGDKSGSVAGTLDFAHRVLHVGRARAVAICTRQEHARRVNRRGAAELRPSTVVRQHEAGLAVGFRRELDITEVLRSDGHDPPRLCEPRHDTVILYVVAPGEDPDYR